MTRIVAIVTFLLAGTAWADTVTITGKPHIADGELFGPPLDTLNEGARTQIDCGNDSADGVLINLIMRLDKSTIPAGTITGFRLNLYRQPIAQSLGPGTIKVFRIKNNPNWVEGTTGAAQPGSSCWDFLAYNTTNWAGGMNGVGVNGTDYISDPSPPSLSYSGYTSGPDVLMTFTLPASWASDWRDNVIDDQGIVLLTNLAPSDVISFKSTENSVNKPSFQIDFIPLVTVPSFLFFKLLKVIDLDPDTSLAITDRRRLFILS